MIIASCRSSSTNFIIIHYSYIIWLLTALLIEDVLVNSHQIYHRNQLLNQYCYIDSCVWVLVIEKLLIITYCPNLKYKDQIEDIKYEIVKWMHQ